MLHNRWLFAQQRAVVGSPLIVPFPGTEQTTRTDVGGKAASLICMSGAGLPVPPGAVLTSAFFTPWYDEVKASATWTKLIETSPDDWAPLCSELKKRALTLPLTVTQHEALHALLPDRVAASNEVRFAVRSSSPDEDLASASFAGGYETRLGVRPADLEDAVRACFASSLDLRVFIYKKQHGFDVWSPRIAVVVQQQVDSEVAGVGFSLNPVTNDYDEAVIEANWGLGTSVVEGLVSPDHFVVNKVERRVVEETRGDKHLSIWLDSDGGTTAREKYRSAERTLNNAQIHELIDMISRIEALYDTPVDVEWAYAGGMLNVLQARPITTYVPLPAAMITQPGERRRLYADAALSKGLTMNKPISPLGLDCMERLFSTIIESWVGPLKQDLTPEEALCVFAGDRMYMNLSNLMWFASPRMMSRSSAPTDALMAQILAGVDAKQYRAVRRPSWVTFRLLWLIPRVFWRMRGFFGNALRALLFPESAYREYQRRVDAFETELRENLDVSVPLDDFRRTCEVRIAREFDVLMSALVVGMMSPDLVVRGKSADVRTLLDNVTRGVTENVVVEMGLALHRLRFRRKLDAHVRSFPPVIDSRGRILRPQPIEHAPGVLTGMPVSPGVVTGPVKILHTPHEKRVEKGDVLVAYTTDPGWTPLFVNAAAIVLEVGGALQHGALVAREYGKPCVVGIDRVVTKLRDGEPVEVNGTMGTVRLLS